jgi:hypothetical protein
MTITPALSRLGRVALIGALVAGSVAIAAPAHAKGKTSAGGDYAVTIDGRTYNPAPGDDLKLEDLGAAGIIQIRGVNNGFDVDTATLGVYDYTLTGAPDTQRMVTQPTVVFASKVPTLTPAQLAGAGIDQLEVRDDGVVLIFATSAGKLKIQAKDGAQGGIFQMEAEFAGPVEYTHTLGEGLFYFVNPATGKVNFGNGVDAVSPQQDPLNYHRMLIGKDSPQVATKTYQDATVTRWLVEPGGRMGGVLGEDATELSAGSTACTSHCQAQNRIRGSLPVPPDPTNPTPIGA